MTRRSVFEALCKAAIVLVPSYTAAYLTGKMVWTVPTLVAASFFAATINMDEKDEIRVDEDGADGGIDIEDASGG